MVSGGHFSIRNNSNLSQLGSYVVSNVTVVNAINVGSAEASPGQYHILYDESCKPTRIFASLLHKIDNNCVPILKNSKLPPLLFCIIAQYKSRLISIYAIY